MSRGVCAVEDGKLRSVREALKIRLYPDGTLRDLAEGTDLSPETVVSMNFWGFMPSIFDQMETYLEDFLRALPPEELKAECGAWAAQGKPAGRARNIVTSLELQSEKMEVINKRLQEKYKALEENEVRYEAIECDDADYVIVAFGSSARICSATVEMARAEGLKVGLLRPITLYPFPKKQLAEMAARGVKGFLSAELNAGQMVEDVRLAVNGKAPVEHYGRQGGMMFNPDEVLDALKEKLIKK